MAVLPDDSAGGDVDPIDDLMEFVVGDDGPQVGSD